MYNWTKLGLYFFSIFLINEAQTFVIFQKIPMLFSRHLISLIKVYLEHISILFESDKGVQKKLRLNMYRQIEWR